MTKDSNSRSEYWQDAMDKRKLVLQFLSHIWVVLIGIAAGIIIGVVSYLGYHAITDQISYQGYSEFYLDFATDEKGDAYQWYNGYTWTGLMSAEPIVSNTMANAQSESIDVARIEADTLAEIKSDIRVLRVTFTDVDENICADLQSATEKSLVALGSTVKEFNSIEVIKTVAPTRVLADDRMLQAIELGAIAGLIISLIIMWFVYILDERIMTLMDLSGLGVPVLGARLKSSDEKLAVFMNKLADGNMNSALSELAGGVVEADGIYHLNLGEISKTLDDQALDQMLEAQAVVLDIPYKAVSKSFVRLVIDSMHTREIPVVGLTITEADNRFYKAYYSFGRVES